MAMACLVRFSSAALTILLVAAPPGRSSIRQVDFRNFAYLWNGGAEPENLENPWHWIESIPSTTVRLEGGVHRFWEEAEDGDRSRAPGLWFESVKYGDLDGDGKEEAAVDLNYSGGGTANWDYLYVYKLDRNGPRLLGWLESGSRGYGGLVGVAIQNQQLVLDFADPERQDGDCCSDGYIRLRYVWKSGHFVETGHREKGDLKRPAKPATLR
jgi:hypothetical protein